MSNSRTEPHAGQVPDALGSRLAGAFHDDGIPPRQPCIMIPGGQEAPELCQLPRDLIPLAHGRRAAKPPRLFLPALVQLKVDGIRALYIDGRIVTREGVPLDCARHCIPGLKRLERAFGVPMFFDCEYVEEDGFDATASAMRRGTGEGVVWIFDAIPLQEWKTDSSTRSTRERLALLEKLAPHAESIHVGMLKSFTASSFSEIKDHVTRLWAMGYEGAVLKRPSAPYRRRASDDWLRWKETITVDCAIIDVVEKDGLLRALMVKGPESQLRVGSGWSADEGAEILAHFHSLTNTLPGVAIEQPIAEIAYNRKAGSAKPRHARFRRLRPDKKES